MHNKACPQLVCLSSLVLRSDSKIGCASLLRGGILPSNNLSDFFCSSSIWCNNRHRQIIRGYKHSRQDASCIHWRCHYSGTFSTYNVMFYFIFMYLPGHVIVALHIHGCSLEFIHVLLQTFMEGIYGPPVGVSSPCLDLQLCKR